MWRTHAGEIGNYSGKRSEGKCVKGSRYVDYIVRVGTWQVVAEGGLEAALEGGKFGSMDRQMDARTDALDYSFALISCITKIKNS